MSLILSNASLDNTSFVCFLLKKGVVVLVFFIFFFPPLCPAQALKLME